ncbi:uncharacterized protein BJ171DRAFT_8020 [Polychytrium aggregatum]|uniref:uncharacterized protein n=1 Tax=Polychytrium aggregatum TaxID=110093 RepID=UPI0022FE1E03|nr:uncharacterized protein BJ171DRAFT_8020 [Polychytrium aggregatum]KAI9209818.1 hypothetical protein BJ171DRAFT_8020 [Polychytrium aggregatum]
MLFPTQDQATYTSLLCMTSLMGSEDYASCFKSSSTQPATHSPSSPHPTLLPAPSPFPSWIQDLNDPNDSSAPGLIAPPSLSEASYLLSSPGWEHEWDSLSMGLAPRSDACTLSQSSPPPSSPSCSPPGSFSAPLGGHYGGATCLDVSELFGSDMLYPFQELKVENLPSIGEHRIDDECSSDHTHDSDSTKSLDSDTVCSSPSDSRPRDLTKFGLSGLPTPPPFDDHDIFDAMYDSDEEALTPASSAPFSNLQCISADESDDLEAELASTRPCMSLAGRDCACCEPDPDGLSACGAEAFRLPGSGDEAAGKSSVLCSPRRTLRPTIYESFSQSSIDWCRYCGVTQYAQTAAFRPGPWGKRTLCNKHGCDYKGYGYIEKEPRLNLSSFAHEAIEERCRPILQDYCSVCFGNDSRNSNMIIQCDGCPRAYHEYCYAGDIPKNIGSGTAPWYCEEACRRHPQSGTIKVELPKRNLPFMKIVGRSSSALRSAARSNTRKSAKAKSQK